MRQEESTLPRKTLPERSMNQSPIAVLAQAVSHGVVPCPVNLPPPPHASPKPALRSASSVSRSPKSPNIRASNMSLASGESVPLGSHLGLTWINCFKLIMYVHQMLKDEQWWSCTGMKLGSADMNGDDVCLWAYVMNSLNIIWMFHAWCMSFCSEISETNYIINAFYDLCSTTVPI